MDINRVGGSLNISTSTPLPWQIDLANPTPNGEKYKVFTSVTKMVYSPTTWFKCKLVMIAVVQVHLKKAALFMCADKHLSYSTIRVLWRSTYLKVIFPICNGQFSTCWFMLTSKLRFLHGSYDYMIQGWLKPKALTQIPWELQGWVASDHNSIGMGNLPSTWFPMHHTTYGPPNHNGNFRVTKYLQPSMWEPRGLPTRDTCVSRLVHAHSRCSPLKRDSGLWGASNAHSGITCRLRPT